MLVSNHTGALDAFLINVALPAKFKPVRTLAADWLFKSKGLKFFLESLGAVPVCRTDPRFSDPASKAELSSANKRRAKLANLIACGRQGQTILMFPQGRIMPEGKFGDCRKGAAEMILEIPELTVIPIAVHGTQNMLFQTNPDSQKLRLNLKNLWNFCGEGARGVTITFGRPLDYRYLAEENQRNRHIDEETLRVVLTNEIKYKLIRLTIRRSHHQS